MRWAISRERSQLSKIRPPPLLFEEPLKFTAHGRIFKRLRYIYTYKCSFSKKCDSDLPPPHPLLSSPPSPILLPSFSPLSYPPPLLLPSLLSSSLPPFFPIVAVSNEIFCEGAGFYKNHYQKCHCLTVDSLTMIKANLNTIPSL